MMAGPEWSDAFGKFARTLHFPRSPLVPLQPTRSTWKSFGSRTIWSQRSNVTCLEESWHNLTLQKLRYKLFLLPGELTRPQNRPILRLRESPILRDLAHEILERTHRLKPLDS